MVKVEGGSTQGEGEERADSLALEARAARNLGEQFWVLDPAWRVWWRSPGVSAPAELGLRRSAHHPLRELAGIAESNQF